MKLAARLALVFVRLYAGLLGWFFPAPASTPRRRRYARGVCSVCGGTFAMTSKGLWAHRCLKTVAEDRAS
jgi:hypothetical protein